MYTLIIFSKKLDPIIKLKLKRRDERTIPIIAMLKDIPSNRLKNIISKNRGKVKYEYNHLKAVAVQLSCDGVDKLSELPEITCISYDRKANICMDKASGCVGLSLNNPYNLTGRNVNIAIIDTGAYPHGDLVRPYRVVTLFKDFVNACVEAYDDNGHGTHLCGIIAGSGSMSGDKYKGIAQSSRIIALKAFNNVGEGAFSDILAAIDWAIENKEKYKIRILCLPFGADVIVPPDMDPLSRACQIAWDMGLVVIAASGNKGPNQGSITTPGVCPSIITVGCCDCRELSIRSWQIPAFSGRGGNNENIVKPDFIAPGTGVMSLSSDKTYTPQNGRRLMNQSLDIPYCTMTGTSVSTAVATGCIALLLEKMPVISCKDLKGMLKLTCQTLNEPKSAQGYGVINIKKLLNE